MSTPPLWLILLSASFFGWLTRSKAIKHQRHQKFWALMGFCFGLWGFLAFYITKPKHKSQIAPLKGVQEVLNLASGAWYYAENSEIQGPVSQDKIKELFLQNSITQDTLVWHESLVNWEKLEKFKA